jgi:hypothetical protein
MMNRTDRGAGPRRLLLSVLGLSLAICGADTPRTIDAGGLTFKVPADWKSSPPSSSMRRAELKVEPIEGDSFPAELVVFAFPGGAGTVEANIKRWQNQFKDKDGEPPKVESKTVKGKNTDVTRVETAGHYYPTRFPGRPAEPDRPDARLLGAIVQGEKVAYFLKMIGPDKTMQKIRPAFDDLIASLTLGD